MSEDFASMPQDEFCRRFKARMIAVIGERYDDGSLVADEADQVGPTCWEDERQREDGPEECADTEMYYARQDNP